MTADTWEAGHAASISSLGYSRRSDFRIVILGDCGRYRTDSSDLSDGRNAEDGGETDKALPRQVRDMLLVTKIGFSRYAGGYFCGETPNFACLPRHT